MIAAVGYRGKVAQQEEARRLRALGHTYNEIVAELGVAKSSVSLWCRDVEVDEAVWRERARANRNYGARIKRKSSLSARKEAEIDELREWGRALVGRMTEREFLLVGAMLYAGEGAKTQGAVKLPNSDPRVLLFFVTWLRRFFVVDESRLRVRLYLHRGLDLEAAEMFWSELTGIPRRQFIKPYRAEPDPSIRKAKHPLGCPCVSYSCARTHRAVMGLVDALLTCETSIPG